MNEKKNIIYIRGKLYFLTKNMDDATRFTDEETKDLEGFIMRDIIRAHETKTGCGFLTVMEDDGREHEPLPRFE